MQFQVRGQRDNCGIYSFVVGGCANNTGSPGNLGLAREVFNFLADRIQESSDLGRPSFALVVHSVWEDAAQADRMFDAWLTYEAQTILAVVTDLFFSAKINEAAKRAGVTLKYVTTEKDLLEKAKADPVLIIFDLNFEAVRPIESIRKLKGTDELKHISILGYLSHVQTDLQRLAQEAGCDTVMPRSAFSMNLGQILMRHAKAGA